MTIATDPFTTAAGTSTTSRPAASAIDEDVDFLLGMGADQFRTFVLAHLGRDEPERIWTALCHPDVVARTSAVLRDKTADVDQTLRARRQAIDQQRAAFGAGGLDPAAWRQAHADYRDWHRRTLRFSRLLQARTAQVRTAQVRTARQPRPGPVEPAAGGDDFATLLRTLTQAVNTHRLASIRAGLEPEPHDQALWGLLDQLRLSDDDGGVAGLSLAEALLHGGVGDTAEGS